VLLLLLQCAPGCAATGEHDRRRTRHGLSGVSEAMADDHAVDNEINFESLKALKQVFDVRAPPQ
jgi:hypothetical protein